MARFADPRILLRVSEANKRLLENWQEGTSLEQRSGHTVDDLRNRATADRLDLAVDFRRRGDRLMAASPPMYRDAISRYYYAMYHSMRAVVYFSFGGDDHEKHSVLPGYTPEDFEDSALWQNAVKDARTTRNAADYEPYPKSNGSWRSAAEAQRANADRLIRLCRGYLQAKGCRYL